MTTATESISGRIDLDADAVALQVDSVLSEDLYWFPVRHHSPAVARHLEQAILQRKPKIIFIEGPSEANDLIEFVIDRDTRPPVAIYSSYRDDDNVLGLAGIASPAEDVPARFSCWYPLLSYSPEYVALQAAKKIGATPVFMDLPHHALIPPAEKTSENSEEEDNEVGGHSGSDNSDSDGHESEQKTLEVESDRLIVESGFYQALAAAAGYRSWAEAWDSLFEIPEFADVADFRRELATFCAAARATSSPARIESDGTLPRERHMLKTIRDTLQKRRVKPRNAMVVCGGFHLFLDRDDPEPPPQPPPGTVYTSVVPYSFFRVSELSGYGAGTRAPQFYQSSWELMRTGRPDDFLAEHVVSVLKHARREGHAASSADAISITQHARMLASLRGRLVPVLDDLDDAIITCCCKGDPDDEGLPLRRAIDHVAIGTKVGKVTKRLGRLPIVNDFYAHISDLDLGEVLGRERRVNVSLDKRETADERRSVFLHRLTFLKIPLAKLVDAPETGLGTGTLFKEKWALHWSPRVEEKLIETNLYGDSVETAVLASLHEQLARDAGHAGDTCRHLRLAIDMDLPNLIVEIEHSCGEAIDHDGRFVTLTEALGHLTVIDRYAVYRNLRRSVLEELIVRCFDRACFAIPDVASAPVEQQEAIVDALKSLAEVTLQGQREELDRSVFAEHVRSAANESTVPFLRGAFLGMLTELRQYSAQELAGEISAFAKGPQDQMVTAGDFLEGLLAVSRTSILLGADAIVGAIDELVNAAEWDCFLTMLPRMRAAFERLHERQCDSLASAVARRYGLEEDQGEVLTEIQTSVGAAALIARIDRQVAAIMEHWSFE